MSTTKVPFIAASLVFAWRAMTPPSHSPPPGKEDKALLGGPEGLSGRYLPLSARIWRAHYTLACLAEIAMIIALKAPDAPLSKRISSFFPPEAMRKAARVGITRDFLVGTASIAAGSLLRDACYRALGRLFTFQLLVRKEHRLVTDGPYSYMRHPSYTGMFLLAFGMTVTLFGQGSLYRESGLAGTLWGKALWIWWASQRLFEVMNFLGRTYYEDRIMKEQFGEEWEVWAKNTPYRIIPYVW